MHIFVASIDNMYREKNISMISSGISSDVLSVIMSSMIMRMHRQMLG